MTHPGETVEFLAMAESITGRDGYIIKQALYYAIKYIDGLPDILREYSDRADMVSILLAMDPDYFARMKQLQSPLPLPPNAPPALKARLEAAKDSPISLALHRHRAVPPIEHPADCPPANR
jgi:hypothetical protein